MLQTAQQIMEKGALCAELGSFDCSIRISVPMLYICLKGLSKISFLLTESPLKISFSCFLTPRKGFKLAFGALGSDSPHEGAMIEEKTAESGGQNGISRFLQ